MRSTSFRSPRSGTAVEKTIVIGAGIGGLGTALALRQAGIDAVVAEQAKTPARLRVGASLAMWVGGMWALRELGLADEAHAVGAPLERFEYCSPRGKQLTGCDIGPRGRERFGLTPVGITRADLQGVLIDALGRGTTRYGRAFTGLRQDADGVTAFLSDGTEERGDVLVGADGLHSTVRAALHGRNEPWYAGYSLWGGDVEQGVELTPPDTFRILFGEGTRFAFLPVGGGRVCWWCACRKPLGPAEEIKPLLMERFRGWAAPCAELVAATPAGDIHRRDIYDRRLERRWGEGRITLVGDAALPITFNVGQGAGTALRDGVLLAQRLSEARDVPAALRAYERARRRPRATLAHASRVIGTASTWQSPVAVRLHDVGLRLARVPILRLIESETDLWTQQSTPRKDRRRGSGENLTRRSTPRWD